MNIEQFVKKPLRENFIYSKLHSRHFSLFIHKIPFRSEMCEVYASCISVILANATSNLLQL